MTDKPTFTMPLATWQELTQKVTTMDARINKIEKVGWAVVGLLAGSGLLNGVALLKALTE